MNNRTASLLLLVFFGILAPFVFASKPPVKYLVKFKDKKGTPFTLDNPTAFLSTKSINRRNFYHVPLHESDLPVSPSYFAGVDAVPNVRVLFALKWLNAVVIYLDSSDLAAPALSQINSLPYVSGSEKVKRYAVHSSLPIKDTLPFTPFAKQAGPASSKTLSTYSYGGSETQNKQLNADCLHEKGFRGQGMTIAVMDAGFGFVDTNPVFDSLRNRGGLLGTRNFVNGGTFVYTGSTHGTMVMSCMAANVPGLILGTAPMANYWLLTTEEGPGETISEEYNWIRGAEFADSVGADILTTSLGYTDFDDPSMNHTYQTLNGRTAPMSIAATMASRKGLFVLNAAGNERASAWHFISVPSDADSICSVGAVDGAGLDAPFSSVGPTADGRIKPDLMARGAGTWVSESGLVCFPGNGTSFATPVLAGAVACYWQAHRDYNNMKILENLKKSASRSFAPDTLNGWGIPNLCQVQPVDFTAYCDPGTSIITIELIESTYNKIAVEICDLNGKVLYQSTEDPNDRTFLIDSPSLSDAVYLVTLKTSNGDKTKKILRK
ncbi:MAG: S8 family peptidase [bacterium]|nr:S8 family peptidase [bacterium]